MGIEKLLKFIIHSYADSIREHLMLNKVYAMDDINFIFVNLCNDYYKDGTVMIDYREPK